MSAGLVLSISGQGCIKLQKLPNDDMPILCLLRILLVVVLVIGLFARLLDYDYEDEDDDDRQIGPSTEPGSLGSKG
jgi:hypothetical protein